MPAAAPPADNTASVGTRLAAIVDLVVAGEPARAEVAALIADMAAPAIAAVAERVGQEVKTLVAAKLDESVRRA